MPGRLPQFGWELPPSSVLHLTAYLLARLLDFEMNELLPTKGLSHSLLTFPDLSCLGKDVDLLADRLHMVCCLLLSIDRLIIKPHPGPHRMPSTSYTAHGNSFSGWSSRLQVPPLSLSFSLDGRHSDRLAIMYPDFFRMQIRAFLSESIVALVVCSPHWLP
jgi:hypothetical protein